jgi:hypothetical protein
MYPLAPLQEGISFEHLLKDRCGDASVLPVDATSLSEERMEELIDALQAVVARHELLRSAVLNETPRPMEQIAEDIERIVRSGKITDIYPSASLQDRCRVACVLPILLSVSSEESAEELIDALQRVIDGHAVVRSSVLWEDLPWPMQVVQRRAVLPVEPLVLQDPFTELRERMLPERLWLDISQAPLMRLQLACDVHGAGWHALLRVHHIACDFELLDALDEALAYGRTYGVDELWVETPTPAVGGADDGELYYTQEFDPALARRIGALAPRLGASAAALLGAARVAYMHRWP